MRAENNKGYNSKCNPFMVLPLHFENVTNTLLVIFYDYCLYVSRNQLADIVTC